jgi:circadian clock protein KaiC
MRLLTRDSLRYRREILRLKQHFATRRATVLLLEDGTAHAVDLQLHSLAHGVIRLEQLAPVYGAERRRLRVIKLRGAGFRGGFHDFTIRRGGLSVFPRLIAAEYPRSALVDNASSGLPALDGLFGGGFLRGTVTLLTGPTGAGKSLLALQFAVAASQRAEKSAAYVFDEGLETLKTGADGIGLGVRAAEKSGALTLQQIDPASLTPGQFVHTVRAAVERERVRLVIIDSLNGYLNAMPEEEYLHAHLHELAAYLRQQGVITIMTIARHGILGDAQSAADVSYLADTIVLFRYYEFRGRIRRAISMPKKRASAHEHTIRDLVIDGDGLHVGPALEQFEGVLSGTPVYTGMAERLA